MEAVKLRKGLHTVMQVSALGNNYLQSSGLGKALMSSDPKRCAQVVSRALNLIWVLSTLIYPYMPATSAAILEQLNAPARAVPDVLSIDLLAGHTIGKPAHLFKKIEENMAEKYRAKFGGLPQEEEAPKPKASKKKGAKAPAGLAADIPRTPEMLEVESKITEQGNAIRALKAKAKTTETDAEIRFAVEALNQLKIDLQNLVPKA